MLKKVTLPFKLIQDTEIEKWRADTFWVKEIETIQWIDDMKGGTFLDVGANIGIYSLYCAMVHKNIEVYGFEPLISNYLKFMGNVNINKLSNCFPVLAAIDEAIGLDFFYATDNTSGSTGGQIKNNVNEKGHTFKVNYHYLLPIISIDFLVPLLKRPIYLKIDIDGKEASVIKGMYCCLKTGEIEGVLVEINSHKDEIVNAFDTAGYSRHNKYNKNPQHSRFRREKEGIKAENIVFMKA